MDTRTSPFASHQLSSSLDFSLVAGGPLFQLLRRARLCDDNQMWMRQSIIVLPLLAWLPLLVLSALAGQLFHGSTAIPFLPDLEVHIRFLLALPLLMIAEIVVQQRMRPLLQEFSERNLIPEDAMTRFQAAIKSALRLRNSVLAEILLIAFVYGVGVLVIWRQYVALDTAAWYATPSTDGSKLSLAGMWYGYVSLPVFQFLLCRWYLRLFIWARFLWQISRIKLSLVPTHPDRLGGLSFLSHTANSLAVLAMAHGTLLAGYLATRVFILGTPLTQFKSEIAVMVAFVLAITLAPLLVFMPQLSQAKRKGLREYGTLASRYVREFNTKWLRSAPRTEEPLMGTGDIQALADLGNSYNLLRTMRIVPITKDAVVLLAVATLLPISPLLLTLMSLEDLFRKLIGMLFK